MKEKIDEPGCPAAEKRRSADEIRRDIKSEREAIAKAVDSLNDRLHLALDWRTYVRRSPLVSLGVAAGLGALAATLLTRRKSPMDKIVESAARSSRRMESQSLFGLGISALLTKLLSEMARSTAEGLTREGARVARGGAGYPETVH